MIFANEKHNIDIKELLAIDLHSYHSISFT